MREPNKRVAVLSPIAWRTPPRQYGAWETVASNIAEGAARQGTKEYVQFLYVAVGSPMELDTQLEISKAIKVTEAKRLEIIQAQVTRITMMLRGLIRSLKAK